MWNRRDWLMLAGSAVAAFGVTLGVFWPRPVNAIDPVNVLANVATPTLQIDGISVHAIVPAARQELWSEAIPVNAGMLPAMSLVVENTTDAPATARFTASLNLASAPVRMSRSLMIPNNGWSSDYVVNLQPHEKQTLLITGGQSMVLNAGQRASLVISRSSGPQVVLGANNNADYVVAVTLVGAVEIPAIFDTNKAINDPAPSGPQVTLGTIRGGAFMVPVASQSPVFSGRANARDVLFAVRPNPTQGLEIVRPGKIIPTILAPNSPATIPPTSPLMARPTVYVNGSQGSRFTLEPAVAAQFSNAGNSMQPNQAPAQITSDVNAALTSVGSNPTQGVSNLTPASNLPAPNDLQTARPPLNWMQSVPVTVSGNLNANNTAMWY